jgi:adenylyl-sulfate kinase
MAMQGYVVWFTGLPSAGKSTLAQLLRAELQQRGLTAELLDGDEVRRGLTRDLGFSKQDRDENIRRIAFVAHLLARNGVVALTAAISPYRAIRDEARQTIGRFVEVYVKCPVEVCMQRDVKGLYQRALAGELPNFTGVSDPYEEPLAPEVVVETHREDPQASLKKILARLEELGYVGPAASLSYVPVPSYLVTQAETQLARKGLKSVSSYLADLIHRDLEEAGAELVSAEERGRVEARLRALGYLD